MPMTEGAGAGARPAARLGILLSGRGSNFLAIHEAIGQGLVPAEIALVVSNRPEAAGLAKARELGLPAIALPHRPGRNDRAEHEAEVVRALEEAGVNWICLAGYMRLLSPVLLEAYPHRVLNVHPSLLPAFPGLAAQRQAWEHGVKVSGATVHLVERGLDTGPIVAQEAVRVLEDDTADGLAARILQAEHRIYPRAVRLMLEGRCRVEGRRVRLEDTGP
jgi:phosphoribosylglycinamide formyltransferase-1